jgi:shikimate kinase
MMTTGASTRGIDRLLVTETRLGADGTTDGAVDGVLDRTGPATAAAGAGVSGRVACSGGADFGAFRRDDAVAAAGVVPAGVGLPASAASAVAVAATVAAAVDEEACGATVAVAPSDPEPPRPELAAADSSHSATLAKTGRPADAASARVAGSVATIDRRRLLTTASRDRRRKFIRDVAIREPYGTTRATFVASDPRMRAAAEVISSSTSR